MLNVANFRIVSGIIFMHQKNIGRCPTHFDKRTKKVQSLGESRNSKLSEFIWIHIRWYVDDIRMRDLLTSAALSTTEIKYLSFEEFVIRLVMMEKFGISNCVTKRDFPNCKCSGELSMCKVKGKKETSRYLTLNSIILKLFIF